MARENQGLQIALIVFVMLTVAWASRRICSSGCTKKAASRQERGDGSWPRYRVRGQERRRRNELKRWIGLAKTENVEAVTRRFQEDMKKYGASYPEEDRFYRPLLERMSKTIKEKNTDLALGRDQAAKTRTEVRGAVKTAADRQQFKEAAAKASTDLEPARTEVQERAGSDHPDESKLQTDLQKPARVDAETIAKFDKTACKSPVQAVIRARNENHAANGRLRT